MKKQTYDIIRGMLGSDVARLQVFLNKEQSLNLVIDGVYGINTFNAVKKFQAEHGIAVDGQWGGTTLKKARDLGFVAVEYEVGGGNGDINWPKKPPSSRIKSPDVAEMQSMFGSFSFTHTPTHGNPQKISIGGNWVNDNIVKISIPQLVGVPIPINDAHAILSDGSFSCHKHAADIFVRLFSAWDEAGLTPKILTFYGAYNARLKRKTITPKPENLSNHSWGSAFDINAKQNWIGALPAVMGERGCVREFVAIANDLGVFWGGHFGLATSIQSRDGMHFEVARL
jgi:peptidoglycan hydrolase-like protein with peptidoglycan-binding domain